MSTFHVERSATSKMLSQPESLEILINQNLEHLLFEDFPCAFFFLKLRFNADASR